MRRPPAALPFLATATDLLLMSQFELPLILEGGGGGVSASVNVYLNSDAGPYS